MQTPSDSVYPFMFVDFRNSEMSGDEYIIMKYLIAWPLSELYNHCDRSQDRIEQFYSTAQRWESIRLVKKMIDETGFFPFPTSDIAYALRMKSAKVCRILKRLRKSKLIEVRVMGIPPTRWVRVPGCKFDRIMHKMSRSKQYTETLLCDHP